MQHLVDAVTLVADRDGKLMKKSLPFTVLSKGDGLLAKGQVMSSRN